MVFFMKFFSLTFLILFIGPLLSGCVSLDSSKKDEEEARQSAVSQDLINTKNDINSTNGRIDEIEYKISQIEKAQNTQSSQINSALKDIREENKNSIDKKISAIESKIESLEKEIESIQKKQEQDKKEMIGKNDLIIDEVSKENKELRDYVESLRKAINTQTTKKSEPVKTEGGYYTVAQGDTLLKISQRTGVTISKIMEINGIKDPNSVYVGQKLKMSDELN